MKRFQLKGCERDFVGRKATIMYRQKLFVPCVLYGGKEEVVHFNVAKNSIRNLIYTSKAYIIELNIEKKSYLAILKEKQLHPVTDEVLHMDFIRIVKNEPSIIEIPVVLTGLAEGVKLGGKLSLLMRKLKVKGFYENFPEQLIINVERLGLGKKIRVEKLFFDKLKILNTKDSVVVAVRPTRVSQVTPTTTQ